MKKNKLTEGSIIGALISLSLPIVLADILQTAYQLTDTFWVGRLGVEAVAAVSLSFPLIFLLIGFGTGLSIAGSILVAQYKGKGDVRKVDFVAGQTLIMVFVVSVFLSLFGYLFAEPILKLMVGKADVLPQAVSYMQVSFMGLIFFFGFFVFQGVMRGVGDVRTPLYIVLSTVILNLFLDPLFIFGFWIIPSFGVTGAAIATVITQAISTTIGLLILFSAKYGVRLEKDDLKPDKTTIARMLRLGLPSSLDQSTRAFGFTIMTILAAGFGTASLAVFGIGTRILSFVIIPAIGLSASTSALVGQNMGALKIKRAEKIAKISSIIGFGFLSLIGVLFFVFARPIVAIFIPGDTLVINESGFFVKIMSLTFGFLGLQMIISGVLNGAGNTFASWMISIVSLWILRFPLAYILSYNTSLLERGIWWSFPIANIFAGVFAMVWYLRGTWKKKRLIEDTRIAGEKNLG